MTEPVSPFLQACAALAVAGFELPQQQPVDQDDAADFEMLFDAGAGLEMAVVFHSGIQAFDIEIRIPTASEATCRASLVLARAVDDLKCSLHTPTQQLCVTRRAPWSATALVEDLAGLMAEMVVLGHNLTEARIGTVTTADELNAASMIRG